jgi:uncharacterized membrane-anchored protein
MTKRAKELVKMLERLLKQDHLYSDEQIKEIKSQLRVAKEEIVRIEEQTSKGFKRVK